MSGTDRIFGSILRKEKITSPVVFSDDTDTPSRKIPIPEQYRYQAVTQEADTTSALVVKLNDIVKKMLEGTEFTGSVVLLRKGEKAAGYVYPDGTIFLNQALINKLDSLDEIAAVLAHEVGHVMNETAKKQIQAQGQFVEKKINEFGIGWVHEMASDTFTPALLEKAGFNSFALASAIKKVSGSDRGTVHQGGVTRAAQVVAVHGMLDFKNVPETSFEKAGIRKTEVVPTNLELLRKRIAANDLPSFTQGLSRLHHKDLRQVFKELENAPNDHIDTFIDAFHGFLLSRWNRCGLSEAEGTALFYLCSPASTRFFRYTPTPETTRSLIATMLSTTNSKFDTAYAATFGKQDEPLRVTASGVAHSCKLHLTLTSDTAQLGYVVDESAFISIVQLLNSRNEHWADFRITELVIQFIELSHGTGSTTAEALARRLARTLKENGTRLSSERVLSAIANCSEKQESYKRTLKAFFEIFFSGEGKMERARSAAKMSMKGLGERLDEEHIKTLLLTLKGESFTDEERVELLNFIDDQITQLPSTQSAITLIAALNGTSTRINEEKDSLERGNILYKLSLRIVFAKALFSPASGAYYEYIHKSLTAVEQQVVGLTVDEKQHIALMVLRGATFRSFYFSHKTSSQFEGIDIHDRETDNYDALSKMSWIQESGASMTQKEIVPELQSILLELERIKGSHRELLTDYGWFSNNNPFSENPLSVLLYAPVRKAFRSCVEMGVPESQYVLLGRVISALYTDKESPHTTKWLQAVDRSVLRSPLVPFSEKTKYLADFFDRIGAEGAVYLADQIHTVEEYQRFRQVMQSRLNEYLSGSATINKFAALDNASSHLLSDQRIVFSASSDDPGQKKVTTNAVAKLWLKTHMGYSTAYNVATEKFELGDTSRAAFSSFQDSVFNAQNLSYGERYAIALRAMTDTNGALTNPHQKKAFISDLITGLKITDPFVSSVLSIGVERGDADIISYPLARMQAPLMFRGIDPALINLSADDVQSYRVSNSKATSILKSDTRSLMAFGKQYQPYPNSAFSVLAEASNDDYTTIRDALNRTLLTSEKTASAESAVESISSESEALVSAVQQAGALGVRTMQISAQLMDVPDKLRARMSNAFDSNEGMSKLLFWENLVRLGEKDPAVRAFMESIESLGTYLGGGSLYTTYKATVRHKGQQQEVAFKMLNPNAEAVVLKTHALASGALKEILETKKGYERSLALTSLSAVDLSQEWCLADVNDPYFEVDDDTYSGVVNAYNEKRGSKVLFMPERVFTHRNLKVETMAGERTINKTIQDNSVDESIKQRLIEEKYRFALFQLRDAPSFQDEKGREFKLIHSDPSVGNYTEGDERGLMGVIDRNMYLRIFPEDAAIMENFLRGENLKFLYGFVGRVLALNEVTKFSEKARIVQRVITTAMREMGRQNKSKISAPELILYEVFKTLSTTQVYRANKKVFIDIPLNIRLMMRNALAERQLAERYGLKPETIE